MAQDPKEGGEVIERPRPKARPEPKQQRPPMWKVVLLNDDYTTMEFVIHVLQEVFNRPGPEAYRIMMQVHLQGRGICGTYTFEIAETKVEAVHALARDNGFPLRAELELDGET